MQRFTELYLRLDRTTRTNEKTAALASYFQTAPAADAAWAVYYLTGCRLRRAVSASRLRDWVAEAAGIPAWLVNECYDAVGDLAETLALLLPPPERETAPALHEMIETRVRPIARLDDEQRRALVRETWTTLSPMQRFVWHKLIMGNFRVGAGRGLVTRALAECADVETAEMAHRLMGGFEPTAERYASIVSGAADAGALVRPYPFCLAPSIGETDRDQLGPIDAWQVEWKYDGVRAQLIRRGGRTTVWSRGEDVLDEQFPEIRAAGDALPDGTVLDGEIVAWLDDRPASFHLLQRRLGRQQREIMLFPDVPVRFLAFDLLETDGSDIRSEPITTRRSRLEALLAPRGSAELGAVDVHDPPSWDACEALKDRARAVHTEGLMLKARDAAYGVGRTRGPWWKWKVDPHTIDAVLTYAQGGSGRRASLFTDYTFGVWDGDQLVTIAKAYSGLTDEEIRRVDRHLRRSTIAKQGPVRMVRPELVFELAFGGIQPSTRHKSGVALRFPRISRWRHDKQPGDADTLDRVRALLPEDAR